MMWTLGQIQDYDDAADILKQDIRCGINERGLEWDIYLEYKVSAQI
jgi:glutamyl-tRNA(Gln) amidotransferase subunit D